MRLEVTRPFEKHVVGTVNSLTIPGRTLNTVLDPRFTLTPDEVTEVVRHGDYLRNNDGRAATVVAQTGTNWFTRREFLVHQVLVRQFVIFVVWGHAAQIERYLRIPIRLPVALQQMYIPFVLGWDFAPMAPVVAVRL